MIKREKEEKNSLKVSGVVTETTDTTVTIEEKKKDEIKVDIFNLQ